MMMLSGRFLADTFEAMATIGCSVSLNTNHRAESECIIDNAKRISRSELPVFDSSRNFHLIALPDRKQEASLSNGNKCVSMVTN